MYVPVMRAVILKALYYPITNIETSVGYNNDNLLRITFKLTEDLKEVRTVAQQVGMITNVTLDNSLELICAEDHPNDIYKLKVS